MMILLILYNKLSDLKYAKEYTGINYSREHITNEQLFNQINRIYRLTRIILLPKK